VTIDVTSSYVYLAKSDAVRVDWSSASLGVRPDHIVAVRVISLSRRNHVNRERRCYTKHITHYTIDNAHIACGAGPMKRSSVRPYVRLSVPSINSSSAVRRVCCWAPRVQEIAIENSRRRSAANVDSRGTRLSTDMLHYIYMTLHCTFVLWFPAVHWRCWLGGRKGIRPE